MFGLVKRLQRRVGIILLCISPGGISYAVIPQFEAGVSAGTVESSLLNEASGLSASRKNKNVLWAHNDSGDSARVFAMSTTGRHLGIYNLSGAATVDWEDMALGPGPVDGIDYLYLGDIGDNGATRPYVKVYRVPEPVVDANQSPVNTTLAGVQAITLQYPDGARDAETLMVDPLTKDIYIISKRETYSRLYRASYPQSTTAVITMEYKCSLPWGWATGGDISADGREIIVRGYFNASVWQRDRDADLSEAFSNSQFPAPLRSEPQGEAICFVKGFGCGYFTVSENIGQPIYYFRRILPTDLDNDCDVDMADLAVFVNRWLNSDCSVPDYCSGADLNDNNVVEFGDFVILAGDWLYGR
ncbi:MAG: hypothetical protein ABIG61_01030 [Planctomycetota bacterium]